MIDEKTIRAFNLKSIFTYLFMVLFAMTIMARVVYIQVYEGEELRQMGKNRTIENKPINALRGNIYSSNGSLLAVTIPKYEIRLDLVSNKSKRFFNANVDSLAYRLSKLFRDRSKATYKRILKKARARKNYYLLIKRNVSYQELTELKTFPILRLGRNKGGLIAIKSNRRELPYQDLAKRTIGIYNYERGKYEVGLEGAFNEALTGTHGRRLMQKIEGGVWMPIDPANEIKPKNGNDLITTIDIDIQDIAETALRNQLKKYSADHGCVVVMQVATGEVKAIANLGRDKNGQYSEVYNYAIGEAADPGSTFKPISLLVALDDGVVNLNDSVDTENGKTSYYGKIVRDDHKGEGVISVRDIIEHSSNVGISKVIWANYQNQPEKFIDGIYKIGLQNKLDIPLKGEASPYIKNPKDKSWSGISLPWISYGYELRLTPLQILTFYNAIANDGKMLKPLFVKEIKNTSEVIETYEPIVINEQIASEATLEKLKSTLEGVVLRGTAKNIRNSNYSIAGKTGTAQMANRNKGYSNTDYRASFCGYFPADNPQYSIIVAITKPRGDIYGSSVAAPVFKYISDRIYSNHVEIASSVEISPKNPYPALFYKAGASKDYQEIYKIMKLNPQVDAGSEFVICLPAGDSAHYAPRSIPENRIPKVIGMTAKDAVYLLEEKGLQVSIVGSGFVKKQSLNAGTLIKKGMTITLKLSAS